MSCEKTVKESEWTRSKSGLNYDPLFMKVVVSGAHYGSTLPPPSSVPSPVIFTIISKYQPLVPTNFLPPYITTATFITAPSSWLPAWPPFLLQLVSIETNCVYRPGPGAAWSQHRGVNSLGSGARVHGTPICAGHRRLAEPGGDIGNKDCRASYFYLHPPRSRCRTGAPRKCTEKWQAC